MTRLPVRTQYSREARFAGKIAAFVSQHRYDACRGQVRKSGLVGHRQDLRALRLAQRVSRHCSGRGRTSVPTLQPAIALPTLQGACIDARHRASVLQPCSLAVGLFDGLGDVVAIFQGNHSSVPCWKIASSFFDSTSSAAVSARALSLRRRLRSNSRIRLRSSRVCCGLARSSAGLASAAVALVRHRSSSATCTPCSRHQPLRCASFIPAVTITASSRPAALQARSGAGLERASATHRSSVDTDTPISCETSSTRALSGGSSLATARSLKAFPYLAMLHPQRPQDYRSIEAATTLTRGEQQVNVATAHLWDGAGDDYNVPYVRALLPGIRSVIVNITYRMQGLYVAHGNPKNILSWRDFGREDLTMINRERGADHGSCSMRTSSCSVFTAAGYRATTTKTSLTSLLRARSGEATLTSQSAMRKSPVRWKTWTSFR